MKVSSWQDIIISWANALRLLDEPVNDVLDLVKGSFFLKLLNKIKKFEGDGESSFSEDDVYNVIENFLKEEFSGFRLLGYWDNDEVTLVSSVLLLWSSLESQSCRTPLYELDDSVQIKIQAFIQRFIETPQHLINRQLVMDAVLDITFDNESEEESLNFSSSPKTYSTPKRPSPSNYTPAMFALSEMRSLRSKVDLLSCEKQHLQEELEVMKSQLSETRTKLQQKEMELMRMSNYIACSDCEESLKVENDVKCDSGSENSSTESSLLKMELEELKDIANKLRQDLESTVEENMALSKQLDEEVCKRKQLEQKSEDLETRNISLSSKVEELELLTNSLKKTCEEQSLFLAEKMMPVDEDSLRLSDCETLGSVVDIKYSELKEELKAQKELFEEKNKEVKDLLLSKETLEMTINVLKKEIEKLKYESNNDIGQNSTTNSEHALLQNRVSSLELNYDCKYSECETQACTMAQKTVKLKFLEHCKSFNERSVAGLERVNRELISNYEYEIKNLKKEIIALQCDVCEKNNSLDYYRDEVEFLNSCLASKELELKSSEGDYTKINISKDREICQLMKTVEHLNREVRTLQEQLKDELSRDKHGLPPNEWRMKLSQGVITANEEIARELIALHESLHWKTLKMSDLSLQIDELKCEISDKETLNKELHERLVFLSEKNREVNRELQASRNNLAHLQSKITTLEYNEKKLNQEIMKKNKKYELIDFELKELWKLLRQKFHTIDLEMDTCMLRGKSDLQDIIQFIDFMCEKWKENRKNISFLTIAINELEADNAEKTAELQLFENKLACASNSKVVYKWINQNEVFCDKLRKVETDYENNMIKLQSTLTKLDEANKCLNAKDEVISELQSEVMKLTDEVKEKSQLIECLQQNINIYEHEKIVLKRRLVNLSPEKPERGHSENVSTKDDATESDDGRDITSADRLNSIEDKDNQGFHEKLLDLQSKMKTQFDEDMKRVEDEYSKKIEQLKGKVRKDCVHIEHLSSELWETSDRLLLAQQEADALRSQLKRTKMLLNEHTNRGTEDCSSFMWLGNPECVNYAEGIGSRTLPRSHLPSKTQNDDTEEEDAMFNQQCLEDLKAGICRLPSPIGRLSCPAESTRLEEDCVTFVAPTGKPRKLKGSIMYRKPGPPTPSISAARHSLPGTDRLELRKGLREQNSNVTSGRSRLSQLFGSITLSKSKNVQEEPTPKVKRKSFFQRTFGNRENLVPKS